MTHFRLQRAVRSRITFRGRGTTGLWLTRSAASGAGRSLSGRAAAGDEMHERAVEPAGGEEVALRGAHGLEDAVVAGRVRAEVGGQSGEQGMEEALAAGVFGLDLEHPPDSGQQLIPARGL